eukprot:jgi/Tetstr1/455156/TSEL_042006.t1
MSLGASRLRSAGARAMVAELEDVPAARPAMQQVSSEVGVRIANELPSVRCLKDNGAILILVGCDQSRSHESYVDTTVILPVAGLSTNQPVFKERGLRNLPRDFSFPAVGPVKNAPAL